MFKLSCKVWEKPNNQCGIIFWAAQVKKSSNHSLRE